MYKKISTLFLAITFINFACADTPQNPHLMFTNSNQLKLDQRASAQQRINHLQNRYSKAEMGHQIVGGSIFTGSGLALCASFIQDQEIRNKVWCAIGLSTVTGMVLGGSIIGCAENKKYSDAEAKEIDELQKFIIESDNK